MCSHSGGLRFLLEWLLPGVSRTVVVAFDLPRTLLRAKTSCAGCPSFGLAPQCQGVISGSFPWSLAEVGREILSHFFSDKQLTD